MASNQVNSLTNSVDFDGGECYEPNFHLIPPFGDYDYNKE
jgi:hypothetical protein